MAKRGVAFTNEHIIKALQETKGMVYLAAQKLGCDPTTISKRAQKSAAIRAAIEGARGEMIDVAEVALMTALQAKQPWAIAFTLKTIGKGRGYVERVQQEVSGTEGGPLTIRVVYADHPIVPADPAPSAIAGEVSGPALQLPGLRAPVRQDDAGD